MRALGAIVALLAACRVAEVERTESGRVSDRLPARFTVVTWNIAKAADERLRDDLAALVAREQPHLVFLQEAPADLGGILRMAAVFAASWRYPFGKRTIGAHTYVSATPLDVRTFPTKAREFLITAPKLSLATTHRIGPKKTLLAINVHGMAFARARVGYRWQFEDLRALIAEHDGPVLLAGDFNTWSRKRLEVVEKLARDLGLREVAFPEGRTTSHVGILDGLAGVDPTLPLDRIYGRGVISVRAVVLPEASSDHMALLASFRLE